MNLEKIILSFFDFIGSIDFNMFGFVLGFVLVVFWLFIIGWVWIDSGERTSKKDSRIGYVLLAVFLNIPGLIIYLIIRPGDTIEEIYWADLERRYLKYETADLGDCPKCGSQLFPGYVHCANCGYEIKTRCPQCSVLVNKDHKYCEFCGFQLRERAIAEEKYPNVEVMEKQITATKEHAVETVESKRTRYKTGHSFVVKLGDAIITPMLTIKERIKLGKNDTLESRNKDNEKEETEKGITNQPVNVNKKQSPKQNQKKKKKRKKKR
jgi:hypothetical protein